MARLLRAVVVAALLVQAMSMVTPAYVSRDLLAGDTFCVKKKVTVPEQPTKLDFVLIIDLSGSYRNDLRNFRNKAGAIFDGISAGVADLRVAVASFIDYPKSPYGRRSDWAYRLHLDFTASRAAFVGAINSLGTRSGGDGPESQLEALNSIVNGHAGFNPGGGNYCSGAGFNCNNPSWRADAAHIIALTTDASAHNSDVEFMYPGRGQAAAIAALNSISASFIAIKAPGAGFFMNVIAAATGGAVTTTDASSNQIVSAILNGIKEITYTVKGVPSGCSNVGVWFNPPVHTGVKGGETVEFQECLKYRGDCEGPRKCHVKFFANSLLIGTEKNVLNCCEDGEFLTGYGPMCRPCPAGTISTDPPSRVCRPCGCGSVANADHTACVPCAANQASAANSDVCVTCGPGTFVRPDRCGCAPCPIDFFCPGTGAPEPCPFGTFALPGSAECTPIECPEEVDEYFSHHECDEWIVGDLDGANPLPYHGLLLRNLYSHGYFGFTFQNDRTPAVGNEVKAFAILDYCRDTRFRVHGLAYGGLLDAAGEHPVAGQSCEFSIEYDTFVSRTGPGNPGHIRVTDGHGWIQCPGEMQIRLEGKDLAGAHLEMMAKYVNEWKANGWLKYPDLDWADPEDRNSTPQDLDFVPLCRLPHTEDIIVA